LRELGASEDLIEEVLTDEREEEAFEVWPENWRALELFLACRTQWRVGAMGAVLGLDYQGVAAVFRMKKVRDQEAMLADLQVMESAALKVFTRQIEERGRRV